MPVALCRVRLESFCRPSWTECTLALSRMGERRGGGFKALRANLVAPPFARLWQLGRCAPRDVTKLAAWRSNLRGIPCGRLAIRSCQTLAVSVGGRTLSSIFVYVVVGIVSAGMVE